MSSTSLASSYTALLKRDDQSASEYVHQPNFRLLCAFFLGWVFIASLYSIVISALMRDAFWRTVHSMKTLIRNPGQTVDDPEAPNSPREKPPTVVSSSNESVSVQRNHDKNSLVFTLNLCFAFAGVAQFISLLIFNSQTAWDTGCAFIVAWGGMSSQCARLVGIIILILDLRRNHIRRWESWALWVGVVIALGFVFAVNAINTGTTSTLAPYGSFCSRKHSLPIPLTSSLIHLTLELYIMSRFLSLRLPPSPRVRDIALSFSTLNMGRVLSLIVLDLLTIVPDAIATSIVVQFIPFSVGSLLVLAAFNVSTNVPGSPLLLITDRGPIVSIDPSPSLNAPKDIASEPPPVLNIVPTEPPRRKPTRTPSHAESVQSIGTVDTDMIGSVEDAVVRTAIRYLPSPQTPTFPHSAPPRFGDTPITAPGSRDRRHIMPSQSLFVEQLEQDQPSESGPSVRRPAARTPMSIVVHNEESDESQSTGAATPGSAVFGSDIVQITPGLRRVDTEAPPTDPHASIIYSPRDSLTPHPGQRDSTVSTQYVATPTEYSPEERRFSALSRRLSAGRTSFLGRDALKSPWRSISRYSFASARTKSREELPTLPEGEASDGASASQRTRSRKRTTFGQISSKRAGKEPAYLTSPWEPEEPVPPLPTAPLPPLSLLPGRIRSLPVPPMPQTPTPEDIDPHISAPRVTPPSESSSLVPQPQLLPLEPPPPLTEQPPPPESPTRSRATGSGQIKGPRPRPSDSAPDPSSAPDPDVEKYEPPAE